MNTQLPYSSVRKQDAAKQLFSVGPFWKGGNSQHKPSGKGPLLGGNNKIAEYPGPYGDSRFLFFTHTNKDLVQW